MNFDKFDREVSPITKATADKIAELRLVRGNEWGDAVFLLMQVKLVNGVILRKGENSRNDQINDLISTIIGTYGTYFIAHLAERTLGEKAKDENVLAAEVSRLSKQMISDVEEVVDIALNDIRKTADAFGKERV